MLILRSSTRELKKSLNSKRTSTNCDYIFKVTKVRKQIWRSKHGKFFRESIACCTNVFFSAYRRQTQALEAKLTHLKRRSSSTRSPLELARAFSEEKAGLQHTIKELRAANTELKDDIEELTAMVEVLKAEHSGKRGLISEPRSSPVLLV